MLVIQDIKIQTGNKCPYLPRIQFWLALLALQCPSNLPVSPSTDLLVAISAVSRLGVGPEPSITDFVAQPANQSATLFFFSKVMTTRLSSEMPNTENLPPKQQYALTH